MTASAPTSEARRVPQTGSALAQGAAPAAASNAAGYRACPRDLAPASLRRLVPEIGLAGQRSVVLHQAELVVLRIPHHDDHSVVILVPLTGRSATKGNDLAVALLDVIDRHVQVKPNLACFGSDTGWNTSRG